MVPSVTRIVAVFNPRTAPNAGQYFLDPMQVAARQVGVELIPGPVNDVAELDRVIEVFGQHPNGGLVALPDVFNNVNRERIAALAQRHRLPAIGSQPMQARYGFLVIYGVDGVDLVRRAAGYVDRILKGEKPADLPVQAPTKFDLVVNLRTAKALGLRLPESFLVRADEVIE
jgi:putative ABC transport system substrate-binding protein